MGTQITTASQAHAAQIGAVANQHAAADVFGDYRAQKARRTTDRQDSDLAVFARYLAVVSIDRAADDLATDPDAWRGITWGLVAGFVQWCLREGYAVGTVGVLLTTVRVYAGLAFQAGAIDATEHALIHTVKAYSGPAGRNVDKRRAEAGAPTRQPGAKKATATIVTTEQAKALKTDHPDTPQGRRDRLMFCLLINLGVRVGELCEMKIGGFDLANGKVTFWRSKVGIQQTHNLVNGTWHAALDYITKDCGGSADPDAPVLRASRKGGALTHAGMTRFAVAQRVQAAGARIGIAHLSPHDLRHAWATDAVRNGTDAFALRDGGGWATLAMPSRYVAAAAIANQGVKLTEDLYDGA